MQVVRAHALITDKVYFDACPYPEQLKKNGQDSTYRTGMTTPKSTLFKKEHIMHTKISILLPAVFMLVTGTGSTAQDTTSYDDANEQSPVCLTHRISDATGDCRTAFMQAFNPLSRKCGNGDKTLNETSIRYVNEYMSACGCSNECRQ